MKELAERFRKQLAWVLCVHLKGQGFSPVRLMIARFLVHNTITNKHLRVCATASNCVLIDLPTIACMMCVVCACRVCPPQARKLAALKQRQAHLPDGGKSVGISVGASMLVASVAGCVNVMLTNPIW